jgi:hypothetical protein
MYVQDAMPMAFGMVQNVYISVEYFPHITLPFKSVFAMMAMEELILIPVLFVHLTAEPSTRHVQYAQLILSW